MTKILHAALMVFALAIAPAAVAAEFPTRPIRIVIPATPGGAIDITARLIGDKLLAAWGQTVVVDNRAGATGTIGTDLVAKATPDGHTLGLLASSHAINPSVLAKLPYDTVKDFTVITETAAVPLVLVVANSLPVASVKELIAHLKANPDKLSFASSGTGGAPHMAAELFKVETGVRMQHVAYKGSTAAHPDVISGRVPVMFDTIVAVLPQIRAGRLKALAVTVDKRPAQLSEVPTIAESGVAGYNVSTWGILVGPAGMQKQIVEKLNVEVVKALRQPDVREKLALLGAEPVGNTPAEANKFVLSEIKRWADVASKAGIQKE